MYKLIKIRDKVRVPPAKFGLSLEDAIRSSLQDVMEGTIDKQLGVILAINDIGNIGEGRILPGDGALHYPAEFTVLTYYPEQHELVRGDIIEVTEFGVFVRIGPLDGMVHVSQLMDDFVSFDSKNTVFAGRDSKRIVKIGDTVSARLISVSMDQRQYKIGLTMRQPGLGNPDWKPRERAEEKRPRREGRKLQESDE